MLAYIYTRVVVYDADHSHVQDAEHGENIRLKLSRVHCCASHSRLVACFRRILAKFVC